MAFVILVPLLIIILSIIYAIYDQDAEDAFYGFIIAVLVGIVIAMFSFGIGTCIKADEVYDSQEKEIVALSDNTGTDGQFFLGTGYIEEDLYYYYISQTEDGGKKIEKTKTEDVTIYEDEEEAPYLVTIYKRNSSWLINLFFYTDKTSMEIHIPKNSIVHKYNIDLE